ncbi:hypothetical protein RBU49_11660 [Clostridium sp. MB40-C1]|uniref:hypothetical protein n=1 Tax=Clostridium sp. MB40-C1 TaxID=3070996 RepID=UPI0027E1D5F5|nr:hypothetical protein [Clostridium sp. MB40-C1]WMJ79546.1 hypothetical protein RBU49_11660 [Clostridium sp. MB40-C1]
MNNSKFDSLQELKNSIEIGLDIECTIYGTDYYIGWANGKCVIALCPDGDIVYFNTLDEILDYKIQNKMLKNIWKDIQIKSMQ